MGRKEQDLGLVQVWILYFYIKEIKGLYRDQNAQLPIKTNILKSLTITDYDKNGGQSSNVDSGRGSVAYSSGRRPEASLHDTSADSDAVGTSRTQPQPGTSQQAAGQSTL